MSHDSNSVGKEVTVADNLDKNEAELNFVPNNIDKCTESNADSQSLLGKDTDDRKNFTVTPQNATAADTDDRLTTKLIDGSLTSVNEVKTTSKEVICDAEMENEVDADDDVIVLGEEESICPDEKHPPFRKYVCRASPNVALVKYWGKRDTSLVLPLHDSLSVAIGDELHTETAVSMCHCYKKDEFRLNGYREQISDRMKNVLRAIREKSKTTWKDLKIRISTYNNFPTRAGLASSASGYACLTFTLLQMFEVDGVHTDIARLGSGSACRGLFGGFVQWDKGSLSNGSDCISHQIFPPDHWSDLRIIVAVVRHPGKEIGSTAGMQSSVESSELLQYRVAEIVPKRMIQMKKHIAEKNFQEFSNLVMKESNELHAICMDTLPPIRYLDDTSWLIIKLVHEFNRIAGDIHLSYTFDAGPNAFLFTTVDHLDTVLSALQYFLGPSSTSIYHSHRPDKRPHHTDRRYPFRRSDDGRRGHHYRGYDNRRHDDSHYSARSFVKGILDSSYVVKPLSEEFKNIRVRVQPDSLDFLFVTKVGTGPLLHEKEITEDMV